MVGVVSCGSYVPLWRLDFGTLRDGLQGEKAIASYDEDSLTMGVAAGLNCLSNIQPSTIDGLFFATTTSPYREKQISVTAAMALDLREDILTADFGNSLRAGTTALKAAMDTVAAGAAKQIMVIASDTRTPMPGSAFESLFGDGAVALVIGSQNIKARIADSYSMIDEIYDVWRADEDRFVRSWEERFTLDEGYLKVLPAAVSTLLKRNNLAPKDFAKAAFYGPDVRSHGSMAKQLGFDKAQVQAPMFGLVGDTGAAFSLMLLAASLEETKSGEKILLASYGNGADAFVLEAAGKLEAGRSLKSYINSKKVLNDYKKYLAWRGLLEITTGRRRPPMPTPSASALWRERDKNLRLYAMKCKKCGAVQYPPQRVCYSCHTKDEFSSYRLAGKKASLFTYSMDYVSPSDDPPLISAVVDFEGGGRMFVRMTDQDMSQVKVGMPVEMTFRKLFTSEGIHNYFWKCMPARV